MTEQEFLEIELEKQGMKKVCFWVKNDEGVTLYSVDSVKPHSDLYRLCRMLLIVFVGLIPWLKGIWDTIKYFISLQ